mmetsp:Transcript_39328/g.92553  ORF Transcript_39328/g.92553 Transcript_39328/m.92553 type:complete len:89 (+) Transcript_39328:1203-1469(+)
MSKAVASSRTATMSERKTKLALLAEQVVWAVEVEELKLREGGQQYSMSAVGAASALTTCRCCCLLPLPAAARGIQTAPLPLFQCFLWI